MHNQLDITPMSILECGGLSRINAMQVPNRPRVNGQPLQHSLPRSTEFQTFRRIRM